VGEHKVGDTPNFDFRDHAERLPAKPSLNG
jgi:hypothetical protein